MPVLPFIYLVCRECPTVLRRGRKPCTGYGDPTVCGLDVRFARIADIDRAIATWCDHVGVYARAACNREGPVTRTTDLRNCRICGERERPGGRPRRSVGDGNGAILRAEA